MVQKLGRRPRLVTEVPYNFQGSVATQLRFDGTAGISYTAVLWWYHVTARQGFSSRGSQTSRGPSRAASGSAGHSY